jgi:predicted TIM-barrel fold metal-dependent hydrolase
MTTAIDAPGITPPRTIVPPGACDAHSHIFGPFDRFPPHRPSVYALPRADADVHWLAMTDLRVSRGVLTQPAPYGSDPAAMLDAIARRPEALRGIAVADASISDDRLEHWQAGGVAGLRFTEMRAPDGGRYPGSVGFDELRGRADVMRSLGLHAQLWAPIEVLIDWLARLASTGVPVVLDHMACVRIEEGIDSANFDRLCGLIADHRIWVKLVLSRLAGEADRGALRPFHDRLIDLAPDRMLWGSDWPFVRMDPRPDGGTMLDIFADWAGPCANQILVENPQNLYNFERNIA